MIRTTLSACCRAAAVDRFSNNLSIFEILEEITPAVYPFLLPQIVFVVSLTRQTGDPQLIDAEAVCDLDGREILNSKVKVDFQDKLRARQVITIQGIMIDRPGNLRFQLRCKKVLHKTDCTVLLNPSSQMPTVATADSQGQRGGAKKAKKKAKK